jgi:hypothetical protein
MSGHLEKSVNGVHGFGSPLHFVSGINNGVNFLGGYDDVICAGGGHMKIYCSPNRGKDWFFQNIPITHPDYFDLNASYFHDENRIIIVGDLSRVVLTQTGIEHNLSNSLFQETACGIAIYPNPFSEFTTIKSSGGDISGIRIINSAGQTCMEKSQLKTKSLDIQRDELPSAGLYFVQILENGRVVETRKLVD